MKEKVESVLQDFIHFLIDSCPQKGYIPLEEYVFQEDVKTYLRDLLSLRPEDIRVFLSGMSFLEVLRKLFGEHLLHFSSRTLLWVAEIEREFKMLQETLECNHQALPATLQE
ncbi:MAG: hypothetical protein H5U36_09695 [Candidatus Caldatribacterium sp.]|nr:hypothetical protein [Candidatus Caldatribacterium sp.]